MQRASWRRVAALAVVGAMLPIAAAAGPASAASTLTVSSLATTAANDGVCTLPEAIVAANTNTASGAAAGECPAGGATGADSIQFSVAGTINLAASLPEIEGDLTITGAGKVTIKGNSSFVLVAIDASAVTLDGLTLTGGGGGYGGAIFAFNTSLTVIRSVLTGNEADQEGAAIMGGGASTVTVDRTTIHGNASGGIGGGISIGQSTGSLYVYRSTISGNQAEVGAAIASEGPIWVANSTIAGNDAGNFGGGVYLNGTPANGTFENVTITGNNAGSPDQGGSGIDAGSLALVTVRNSIVAGNDTDDATNVDTATNSIVDTGVTGILDPAGLQANGGPTRTIRLLPTAAAAIGQGDAAVCAGQYVGGTDQRGVTRPAGAGCDIGATERETTKPAMTKAPLPALKSRIALSGSNLRGQLDYAGADNAGGSGIIAYEVWRSLDGKAWTKLTTVASAAAAVNLASGHRYRFRVRAIDGDRNVSGFLLSPTFTARLVQQVSPVRYFGIWQTRTAPTFSGGSARASTAAGASATFTAVGRAFTFVSTLAPNRGKAKIYVDGAYVTTIDLYASTTQYRVQAWSKRFATAASHTIRVVVTGTPGRQRVDVDGFGVLR